MSTWAATGAQAKPRAPRTHHGADLLAAHESDMQACINRVGLAMRSGPSLPQMSMPVFVWARSICVLAVERRPSPAWIRDAAVHKQVCVDRRAVVPPSVRRELRAMSLICSRMTAIVPAARSRILTAVIDDIAAVCAIRQRKS